MANPTWFNADFYLKGKLDQLKAVDPEGKLRACLETHLSIMKRFNSMLAMAI